MHQIYTCSFVTFLPHCKKVINWHTCSFVIKRFRSIQWSKEVLFLTKNTIKLWCLLPENVTKAKIYTCTTLYVISQALFSRHLQRTNTWSVQVHSPQHGIPFVTSVCVGRWTPCSSPHSLSTRQERLSFVPLSLNWVLVQIWDRARLHSVQHSTYLSDYCAVGEQQTSRRRSACLQLNITNHSITDSNWVPKLQAGNLWFNMYRLESCAHVLDFKTKIFHLGSSTFLDRKHATLSWSQVLYLQPES